MGFTEVSSLDAEVTIAIGKKNKETGKPYPKQAEGYYLGSRTVDNKRGESKLHFLQTPEGNLGVWGTTDMNRKLSQVKPGTMIRITSTGTKPTPNGDMYTYKVEVDKTNTIEVDAAQSSTEVEDNTGSDYEESDEGTDEDDEQQAALAAAERKARVQEMLAKGKSFKK